MLTCPVEGAEMRQEQRVGFPGEDLRLALPPQLEIDVGRRRGGHDVIARAAADPGGVADEGNPCGRLEEADVMRSVPRSVGDLQSAPGGLDGFAALQFVETLARNRQELA